mgnify:CR=1 FL=1
MKIFTIAIACLLLSTRIIFACECPIKTKDHVSPINEHIIDKNDGSVYYFYWHCGDVKSVSGKCGEWMISIRTCDNKRIKYYSSYLKVLNSQKKNESNLGIYTDSSKDFIPSDRR